MRSLFKIVLAIETVICRKADQAYIPKQLEVEEEEEEEENSLIGHQLILISLRSNEWTKENGLLEVEERTVLACDFDLLGMRLNLTMNTRL